MAAISLVDLFGSIGTPGQMRFLDSYYPDNTVGGGIFVWKPDMDRTKHNGGTIISPTVPWSGLPADLSAYLLATGETNPGDLGCWARYNAANSINIEDFGARPDLVDNQKPIQAALFHGRCGTVFAGHGLNLDYLAYKTGELLIYRNTRFVGSGMFRTRLEYVGANTYGRLISPGRTGSIGIVEQVQNVEITGFTLVGYRVNGEARQSGIFAQNDLYWNIHHNEIAHFAHGIRSCAGAYVEGNQAYFNKISQNNITSCYVAVQFQGATNRNTIETNSIFNCDFAYDFSASNAPSETNMFFNNNIEGCKNFAAWPSGTIKHNTFVGETIEAFTPPCDFRDPGTQSFTGCWKIGNVPYAVLPGKSASAKSGCNF